MSDTPINELFEKIKDIKDFIEEYKYDSYDFVYSEVGYKAFIAEEFAKKHNLPFKIDIDELIEEGWDGYYEDEESSSYYYEEESSYYEDEDEEDSW